MTGIGSASQQLHPLDKEHVKCLWCGGGYSFVTDLLLVGASRPLEVTDVPPLPIALQAANAFKIFSSFAERPTQSNLSSKWLLYSLWQAFRRRICLNHWLTLNFIVVKLGTPLAFWWYLDVLEVADADSLPGWTIYCAAALLTALCCAISVFVAAFTYQAGILGVGVRQAVSVAIYDALLKLPAFGEDIGVISSSLSVDAERLFQACQLIHMPLFCGCLFGGGVAIVALQVGVPAAISCLAFLGTAQVCQDRIQKRARAARRIMTSYTDRRVSLSTQLLQGMRPIRMNGWDSSLREQIESLRQSELQALKVVQSWQALNYAVAYAVSPCCTVILMTIFALTDGIDAVTPKCLFIVLSTVNPCIRVSIEMLPRALNRFSDALVSLERLQRFFFRGVSSQVSAPAQSSRVTANRGTSLLEMQGASFAWPGAPPDAFQLQDVTLRIEQGELVCVLGEVGAGKSALLAAIMGELSRLAGTCSWATDTQGQEGHFQAAYCGQQAWIQSATVRENVLFAAACSTDESGRVGEQLHYQMVLDAAQLLVDIKAWPGGDGTEVGERGLVLSGGQKARVALARAAYAVVASGLRVVLLDDVLAALDSAVSRRVVQSCVLGAMAPAMRIVVLSSPHEILYHADKVLVIEEGKLRLAGEFEISNILSNASCTRPGDMGGPVNKGSEDLHTDTHESLTCSTVVPESSMQASTDDGVCGNIADIGADDKQVADGANEKEIADGRLYNIEDRVRGGLRFQAVSRYFGWAGSAGREGGRRTLGVVALFFLAEISRFSLDFWLSLWTSENSQPNSLPDSLRGVAGLSGMLVAAGFCILTFLCAAVRSGMFMRWAHSCSCHLYLSSLRAISTASLTMFFDVTPTGQLVNRFSRDVDGLDGLLPEFMHEVLIIGVDFVIMLLMCAAATPSYLLLVPPLLLYSWRVRQLFSATARELKRIEGVTRSPVFTHVLETFNGIMPIRAMGAEKYFHRKFLTLLDDNIRHLFHLKALEPWVMLRLNIVAASLIFGVSVSGALLRNVFPPTAIGLGVAYSLNIMGKLQTGSRSSVELEQHLTSAERLDILRDAPQEPGVLQKNTELDVENWPKVGSINVKDLSVRYRPGLPLALKDVSFSVPGGTKMGVVGRSGCGKSTLMQVMLRMLEPTSGSIEIDGIQLSRVAPTELRRRIAVIPQDPYLWRGSLRVNLDPTRRYADEDMLAALDKCHMTDRLESACRLNKGSALDLQVEDSGENFSLGERQLLCLCRALVRHSPVCLLDEATANIDSLSEQRIQAVLKEALSSATVVAIAHRLQTVRSSDVVLRLDSGRVVALGSPAEVLETLTPSRQTLLWV